MEFIEMTGATLLALMHPDELDAHQLEASQVTQQSIIRINRQGDVEVRRSDGWEVLGGLIGDFEARVIHATGLDWATPLSDHS
jgi:hypothetical protein